MKIHLFYKLTYLNKKLQFYHSICGFVTSNYDNVKKWDDYPDFMKCNKCRKIHSIHLYFKNIK
jgi:hypothetical protein